MTAISGWNKRFRLKLKFSLKMPNRQLTKDRNEIFSPDGSIV